MLAVSKYVFYLFYLIFLDVYASLTLQPQPASEKMLRLNKKTFDCFTQRNIRRNLISANHVKQMKLCKDLQHIVRAEGKLHSFFQPICLLYIYCHIQQLYDISR